MIGGMNERPEYTEGNGSVRRLSEGHTETFPITLRRLASIFEGKFEDVPTINLWLLNEKGSKSEKIGDKMLEKSRYQYFMTRHGEVIFV